MHANAVLTSVSARGGKIRFASHSHVEFGLQQPNIGPATQGILTYSQLFLGLHTHWLAEICSADSTVNSRCIQVSIDLQIVNIDDISSAEVKSIFEFGIHSLFIVR